MDAVVFSHVNSIGIGCIVKDEFGQMVAAKNTKLRKELIQQQRRLLAVKRL